MFVTTKSQPETALLVPAELLVLFGSNVELLTFAVLLMLAPGSAVTSTFNVIVTGLDGLIVPSVQCTLPLDPRDGAVHEPCEVLTDENVVPVGVASSRFTLDATSGPALLTVIV